MSAKIECSLMLRRTVFIKHMFLAVLSDQKLSLECLDTVNPHMQKYVKQGQSHYGDLNVCHQECNDMGQLNEANPNKHCKWGIVL